MWLEWVRRHFGEIIMLKLIAHFRAAFSLDSSLVAAEGSHYREFLGMVTNELSNPQGELRKSIHPSVNIDVHMPVQASENEIGARFIGLNYNGSLYLAPRVLTLGFKSSE